MLQKSVVKPFFFENVSAEGRSEGKKFSIKLSRSVIYSNLKCSGKFVTQPRLCNNLMCPILDSFTYQIIDKRDKRRRD